MADYTPVFVPGRVWTATASAAVSGGDLLEVSGSGTVQKANTTANLSSHVIGVAGNDTPINGRVTVYGRGIIHESVANGTVTAGDQITNATSGDTAGSQVKTLAVSNIDVGGAFVQATVNTAVNAGLNAVRDVIGIALTTASNPAKVRWMEV